jgi:hypothetical protein
MVASPQCFALKRRRSAAATSTVNFGMARIFDRKLDLILRFNWPGSR